MEEPLHKITEEKITLIVAPDGYKHEYTSPCGGIVFAHPDHYKDELEENLVACKILADHGHKIQLLPCYENHQTLLRKEFLPDVHKNKNPDIRIITAAGSTKIGDIKTPKVCKEVGKSSINTALNRSGGDQKAAISVINLCNRNYAARTIKNGIVGALQPDRNRSIQEVWIITEKAGLFIVKREFVFDDALYEQLGNL